MRAGLAAGQHTPRLKSAALTARERREPGDCAQRAAAAGDTHSNSFITLRFKGNIVKVVKLLKVSWMDHTIKELIGWSMRWNFINQFKSSSPVLSQQFSKLECVNLIMHKCFLGEWKLAIIFLLSWIALNHSYAYLIWEISWVLIL